MDKPISMSVKDYLIRILAVQTMTSERVIDAVVSHQFKSANEALVNNNSLEISGFGKFFFNESKAEKKMEKMLSKVAMFEKQLKDASLSNQKKVSVSVKLTNTLIEIETLKPKLNKDEPVSDI